MFPFYKHGKHHKTEVGVFRGYNMRMSARNGLMYTKTVRQTELL